MQVVQGDDYKTENYKYDLYGNLVFEQKIIQVPQVGQRTFNTSFAYDAWGRIKSLTYPDSEMALYEYTDAGELEQVKRVRPGSGTDYIIEGLLYDGFGNISQIRHANGRVTNLGYDTETRQLTYVDIFKPLGKRSILKKTIDYDDYGNVASIENTQPTVSGLGGVYDMEYSYDAMNQLQSAEGSGNFNGVAHTYKLAMNYNNAGGVLSKNQQMSGSSASTYKITYTYKGGKKHQVDNFSYYGSINPSKVNYNTSGSVTGIYQELWAPGGGTNISYQEQYQWDEDQKLMAASNVHGIYHYLYDHNGERIMKSGLYRTGVAIGGNSQNSYELDPYTVYVNPYYIATHYQEHVETSKHYYMGSQRIAASLKGASFTQQSPAAAETDGAFENLINVLEGFGKTEGVDFQPASLLLKRSIVDYDNDLEYQEATVGCAEPEPQCECEHSRYWPASCNTADIIYWYHPDYLGNTEFITDRNGDPYQFFWYSPWGESLKDQHKYDGEGSNFFNSTFRFNGKELDEETGNYYYGARYYNPKTSVWLSVDPMSAAAPGWTPYRFCFNNPVNIVDPTGLLEWIPEVDENGNTSYIAEEGDNLQTLMDQYGLNESEATDIFKKNGLPTGGIEGGQVNAGDRISGSSVNEVRGSEVLPLNLDGNITDADINHQAAYAMSREGILDSYEEDYEGNLNDYFSSLKGSSSRTANGTFYGVSTNPNSPTTVKLNGKSATISISIGSSNDGRFMTQSNGSRTLPNGREAYDYLHPSAIPENPFAGNRGLKSIRTPVITIYKY